MLTNLQAKQFFQQWGYGLDGQKNYLVLVVPEAADDEYAERTIKEIRQMGFASHLRIGPSGREIVVTDVVEHGRT